MAISPMAIVHTVLAAAVVGLLLAAVPAGAADVLARRVGKPVDVASSAYLYRADRAAEQNPPEAWILLMQFANQPFAKPIDRTAPAMRRALCGLQWEEVRPVRGIELSWPANAPNRPSPDELTLSYFDATDGTAHTWWNPRTVKDAGVPKVSANGRTYVYTIPVDTWGVVASVRGAREAAACAVPVMRAFVPDVWKMLDLEIEWGFDRKTTRLPYDGAVEAYDGVIANLRSLEGDVGTSVTGAASWRSARTGRGRRGVRLSMLYMGTSRWRRVWPYHAQPEDVARTIITVRTASGTFSFLASDLEMGPILAPEYGFFVRATSPVTAPRAAPARSGSAAPDMHLLGERMESIAGVPRVRGWAANGIPWFGANPDSEDGVAGSLRVPARSVAMHPGTDRNVAVVWRSPLAGHVRVQGRVAMADSAGGNGVEWWLACDRGKRRTVRGHGEVNTGASQAIRGASDITVKAGDTVALVIGPRAGDYSCDTTVVDLTVTEVGGQGQVWRLTPEAVDSIRDGNPLPDTAGRQGVWRFVWSPASQDSAPAPSEPPFPMHSKARSAAAYLRELKARGLRTVRQRVREHPEQTWDGAVRAMHPTGDLPPTPAPAFEPRMQVEVPCERLTAQWKLGAWHILRRTPRGPNGKLLFNDYPFGILASETYMLLRALDIQGMHKEAADGLDQWLRLPLRHNVKGGQNGHHPWALPSGPLGHFPDGDGVLTHAEGSEGAGGHMDGVHAMGPGAIAFALAEHFRLTGDMDWLRANAARVKANAEWVLRQRRFLGEMLPAGGRLWSKGLQPAQVVTPDSECMHMQFYETEAYYWLAVKCTAELLARVEPAVGAAMDAEAEAYRRDLRAAIDRSIALTPVVPVRDGTYRSFVPFAPYVRGFAAGTWGWRRCQGHVGAIYWDTVQSADPLISPSGLLSPTDPRVQGHLDVLEDRLLLENTKVNARTPDYDPERDWFSHASWQYQCGLERHANIHLAADDPANYIRSLLNQYAVDIMPGEYTFREHTTGGPPDKIYEESCFLERFRQMLVTEEGDTLWLAKATPRVWLAQGKRICVKNAPTHFGDVGYEIVSDAEQGRITAMVDLPSRQAPTAVMLRLRHPRKAPMQSVTLNGRDWASFDSGLEAVRLQGLTGRVAVEVRY